MQQLELLHKILEESHAIKHKKRLSSLLSGVAAVLNGSDLSLTSLGRRMPKEIKPKSKIQEVNYLLSNGKLHCERLGIYKAINEWYIGQEKVLFIAIDWSSLVGHQQHLLRASLIRKGRSVSVYEEIHPESTLGQREVHEKFLENLKRVLPEGLQVCILVDAGFKTDFFVQVQTNDWEYVARLLGNMHYSKHDTENWKPCPSLYEQATSEPASLGVVKLAKSKQVDSHLYLYKKIEEKTKEASITIRKIKYGKKEKEYKNAAKKPWLIASSMDISAKTIMAIYKKRMKIEHDFRDSKDPKWGLGLRRSRSVDPMRLIIQLLIGFLAAFILWLIGLCLEKKGFHRDFQANSIKHKRVLSLIFLALEAIRDRYYMKFISIDDFLELKAEGLLHDDTLPVQIL